MELLSYLDSPRAVADVDVDVNERLRRRMLTGCGCGSDDAALARRPDCLFIFIFIFIISRAIERIHINNRSNATNAKDHALTMIIAIALTIVLTIVLTYLRTYYVAETKRRDAVRAVGSHDDTHVHFASWNLEAKRIH